QTIPSIVIGLYTRWLHGWALVAGWVAGMATGTAMAISQGFKPVYPLDLLGVHINGYTALFALVANLVVSVGLTAVLRAVGRRGVLAALGDRLESERVREAHDGLDDRRAVVVGEDAVDEGLVDLQRVDRQQLAQVAQRRVADAEVVDGQLDAERLELAQHHQRRVGVGEHRALGDLQAQALGREAGLLEGLGDDGDELGRAELAR